MQAKGIGRSRKLHYLFHEAEKFLKEIAEKHGMTPSQVQTELKTNRVCEVIREFCCGLSAKGLDKIPTTQLGLILNRDSSTVGRNIPERNWKPAGIANTNIDETSGRQPSKEENILIEELLFNGMTVQEVVDATNFTKASIVDAYERVIAKIDREKIEISTDKIRNDLRKIQMLDFENSLREEVIRAHRARKVRL